MKKTITKKELSEIFESSSHQAEAAEKIYRLAFPDWDNIAEIGGYPSAGEELQKEIFEQFIQLDRKYHPNVMAGGLWLNKGFSTSDKTVQGWDLSTDNCTVTYIDKAVNS